MIEIIQRIFGANGFVETQVDANSLFSLTDTNSGKANFWLVVQATELVEIIAQQASLFQLCKRSCSHEAMDKNISMLILWETNGEMDIRELKKAIMSIEEDIYFFKKNVLYYSRTESSHLKIKLGDGDVKNFFYREIISKDVFKEYKSDSLKQSWQSLLYRVAIKLSFMNLNIDRSDGLASLFKNNDDAIAKNADAALVDFDRKFFASLSDRKVTISDTDPKELLAEWNLLLLDDNHED